MRLLALFVMLISVGGISNSYAFDLPMEFDEPCMGGMGILAAICEVVNDLHDFAHEQETRINSLNATQILQQIQIDFNNATNISQQVQLGSLNDTQQLQQIEINDLQGNVTVAQADIIVLQGNVTTNLAFLNEHHFEDEVDTLQTDLNATEAEVDTLQTELDIAEETLAALPTILIKTLADTEDVDCEDSPGVFAQGWCPDWPSQSLRNFNITDSDVTSASMVSISISDKSFVLPICNNVNTIQDGWFMIHCEFPLNGSTLRYSIITP